MHNIHGIKVWDGIDGKSKEKADRILVFHPATDRATYNLAMKAIAQLEKKLGLSLPPLFAQIWKDGAFKKHRKGKVAILEYFIDFEPIAPADILAKQEEMETVFRIDVKKHKLVPFAVTEQGDHICFCFGGAVGDQVPVVYLPYDEEESRMMAKDLPDYLVRTMIEVATFGPVSSFEETKTEFAAMCDALRPYVSADRMAILDGITQSKEKKQLLKGSAAKSLIKQHLDFPKRDKRWCYLIKD